MSVSLSGQFGFLHLPTLLAFIYPWSPDPTVNDLIQDVQTGKSPDLQAVSQALQDLDQNRRLELYLRLTSLTHERRHFHDLLISPFGNDVLRRSLRYMVGSVSLLLSFNEGRKTENPLSRIPLPLAPDRIGASDLFEGVDRWRRDCNQAAARGMTTMEVSAVFSQGLQGMLDFGIGRLVTYLEWLASREDDVLRVLGVLIDIQQKTEVEAPDFAPLVFRLLLLALATENPDSEFPGMLLAMKNASKSVRGHNFVQGIDAAFRAAEGELERLFRMEDETNEQFLDRLTSSQSIGSWPDKARSIFLAAASDFVAQAKALRMQYLSDPRILVDPTEYFTKFRADRAEPITYFVTTDESTGYTRDETVKELDGDPLLSIREVQTLDEGTVWQQRCVPAPPSPSGTSMSDDWRTFAAILGGSFALVEGVDWLHPIEGLWVERMAKTFGVTFVRSFGQRTGRQMEAGKLA